MYIYTIIGVLEAGDHYVKIPFATIIADFEISKACYGLLICRSQYIWSQLTSITSPISFFSPLIDALFDDGPDQGKLIKLMKILKPIANPLCQGLNDFEKYEFDPSMTNWSV